MKKNVYLNRIKSNLTPWFDDFWAYLNKKDILLSETSNFYAWTYKVEGQRLLKKYFEEKRMEKANDEN